MGKAISLAKAKDNAKREMHDRPITSLGFEERCVGPFTVNVFYYSLEYPEIGTHYRADFYINGKRNTGVSLGHD